MLKTTTLAVTLAGALALSACGKDDAPEGPAKDEPAGKKPAGSGETGGDEPSKPAASDHGEEVVLGKTSVAGFELEVSRLGAIAAGSDAAVAVKALKTPGDADWKSTNLYVWVEDADGQKLTAPEKAHVEDGRLHAHASVQKGISAVPARLVLRVRHGDLDEQGSVALSAAAAAKASPGDGHGHTHEATPHEGVVAPLMGADGAQAGWAELKLHDDKGDLELWLGKDEAMKEPLDIPLNAEISAVFVDKDNRKVTLAPRNTDKNEDEDGTPNLRDGKTNYFVFPGQTGAEASWLKGKDFQSIVTLTVKAGEVALSSDELLLRPHTHGHEH